MQQPTPLTFALPMVAALATGCAYSGEQVAIESPSAMLHQSSVAGVGVGARPYLDPDEAEAAFGLPVVFERQTATGKVRGYLPVLVSFRNDTRDSLVVDKEHTRLISSDGKRAKPRSWERMYGMFEQSVAGAYFAFGIIGAVTQDDANEDMARDWREKELPNHTAIHPNCEGAGGFLYFKDKGGQAPYLLRVALSRPATGERIFVNVVIGSEPS